MNWSAIKDNEYFQNNVKIKAVLCLQYSLLGVDLWKSGIFSKYNVQVDTRSFVHILKNNVILLLILYYSRIKLLSNRKKAVIVD